MVRLLCLCVSFLSFSLCFPGHLPNPTCPFSPSFAIFQYLHTDPLCKRGVQTSATFLCFLAVSLYILCKCLLESDHTHLRPHCLGAKRDQCSEICKARFYPQFPQLERQRLLVKVAFFIGDGPHRGKNSDCTWTQIFFSQSCNYVNLKQISVCTTNVHYLLLLTGPWAALH